MPGWIVKRLIMSYIMSIRCSSSYLVLGPGVNISSGLSSLLMVCFLWLNDDSCCRP